MKINNSNNHIIVLDGIRGLAILLVLIAHFVREEFLIKHFPFFGTVFTKLSLLGLTGVSLFFVLSGFLITSILLNTKNNKNFFKNFYVRRALRIFPLYYCTLFFLFFILPYLIEFSSQSELIKNNQIWLWFYLSNFPGAPGIMNPSSQFALGHLWSLSVEEHFYLIWPIIVYFSNSKTLKKICIGIIFLSIILSIVSGLFMNNFLILKYTNWTTITFSGSLALGGLLAIHKNEYGSLISLKNISIKLIIIFGILVLIFGFIPRRYGRDLILMTIHELSWFLYAGLLIFVLNLKVTSLWYKIFSNKIFLIFGKYSYGIYMFHGLLMPFFEKYIDLEIILNKTNSLILTLLTHYFFTIGITFVLAFFSWEFFEKRILILKKYFSN